jgi:cytochrome c-type biogenesis protein CcmF
VFVGTLYPLALEALTGEKISVGAPFFNGTFGPLFVILLVAVPFGPLLAWKRGDLLGAAQRLTGAAGIAVITIAGVFAIAPGGRVLAPFGIGLAIFVMASALTEIVERTGLLKTSLATAFARAKGLPRSTWGSALAHCGLGVALLGIIGETQWSSEQITELKPGQAVALRQYELTLEGTTTRQGPNYRELAARLTVRRNGSIIGSIEPAKRDFPSRGTSVNESALMTRGLSQLYVSLGEVKPDGSVAVRMYHKPMVLLIWLGPVAMAIGGALSLSDRRLRVGAPKPARSKTALAPAE